MNVTTDAAGDVTFTTRSRAAGRRQSVTATATDPDGNTSEFSAARRCPWGPETFVVTNTNDSGRRIAASGDPRRECSTGTRDTITFNIPGSGPHSIVLQSALPMITDSAVIDGTTEPDFAGTPIVELDGSALPDPYGLHITAGNSVVRGLVISGFGSSERKHERQSASSWRATAATSSRATSSAPMSPACSPKAISPPASRWTATEIA